MDFVFFGIQGAGKGTQSRIAAEKFNLKIFETGAELRKIAAENSPLGAKVKKIIEAGNLVTTEIVMEIVDNFVAGNLNEKILFDGIPRSLEQKTQFDEILKKRGRDFLGILIDLPIESAKKRLLNRRICADCKKVFGADFENENCDNCGGKLQKRADDTEAAILKRLENFAAQTLPAIEKYGEKIVKVDGENSVEKVAAEIEKVLTKL